MSRPGLGRAVRVPGGAGRSGAREKKPFHLFGPVRPRLYWFGFGDELGPAGPVWGGWAVAPATWAGVGTVLYDEGITVIKSPMLAQFGTSSFSMEMRGERPVHVMQIAVPCPAGQINSSSNPTFQPLTASNIPSETSVGPVIITGINFHDDNLNVVARSQLAQPIVKRSEDRFLFRTKIDW